MAFPLGPQSGSLGIPVAAQTTTFQTGPQENVASPGLTIFLNVTAASGTSPTLVTTVQVWDVATQAWYTLNTAPTAIATTGQFAYQIAPLATTAGSALAQATALALPAGPWRVNFAIGGTTPSYTFQGGYAYTF